jgi:RNA polymerase sigma-70 factor (ECF subfamily)
MPLNPSKFLHFKSWKQIRQWLPEATESQLLTVFVWAGEQKPPPGDVRWVSEIRSLAFELLVNRTRDRLHRFLAQRCHCHDSHLVDDLIQQILIKLYLRGEQFDPRRSFWGWLFRIARNEYIDSLRRLRPGDVGVGQTGAAFPESGSDESFADESSPEAIALDNERLRLLEEAVAKLPPLQQNIVRLKRDGISGKDIAVRLGISQAYVSQLYHEAELILGDALQGRAEPPP